MLLKAVNLDVDRQRLPLHSDALVFDELADFTRNAQFCRTILSVASTPSIVVTLLGQPVNDYRH